MNAGGDRKNPRKRKSSADNPDLTGGGRFAFVPADVLTDSSLSLGARVSFSILCSHANSKTQECFRVLETLAEDLGRSTSSVQDYLKELETAGLIVKFGKEGCTGRFRVVRNPKKRGLARARNACIMGERKARFGKPDSSRLAKMPEAHHKPLQPNAPTPAANDSPPVDSATPVTIPNEQYLEEQRDDGIASESGASGRNPTAQQRKGQKRNEDLGMERVSRPYDVGKGLSHRPKHPRDPDWATIVQEMGLGHDILIWIFEQIDNVRASTSATFTQAQWIVFRALKRIRKKGLAPQQALREEIEAFNRRKG